MRDFDSADELYEYIGIDTSEPYDELQHFDFSKIKLPKIDLPKIELPKINLPKIDLPKIDLPFNNNNKKKDKNKKKGSNAGGSSNKKQGKYGREWKDHKWISRKRDKNGKWIYDYGNGFPGENKVGATLRYKESSAYAPPTDLSMEQNNKLSKITGLIDSLGRLLISPSMDDKAAAGKDFLGRLDEIGETIKAKARQFGKRIDEKTGLPLKDPDDNSTLEDDVKKVNPGWNNKDMGSQMNCPECSVAMDLRRRGYEVSAKEDIDGENYTTMENLYPGGDIYICNPDYEGQTTTEAFYNGIADQPEGSCGMMVMQWSGGGGHVAYYTIENGEPIIYDGQSRSRIPASEYTDRCWSAGFMRTDNLEPDWDVVKEMVV